MPERAHRPRQPRKTTEYVQASLLAPEDATLFAELTRLRHLIAEVTARYERRLLLDRGSPLATIQCPRNVADLVMAEMQELPYEEMRVLLLNSKNVALDICPLYRGTLNSSPVRVAEVMRPAIIAHAASIIPIHCHPSGDPTPSPEDVRVTAEIVQAGRLLDIECLDHVIIGRGQFTSLRGRGLGF